MKRRTYDGRRPLRAGLRAASVLAFALAASAAPAARAAEEPRTDAFARLKSYEPGADDAVVHEVEALVDRAVPDAAARRSAAERLAEVAGDARATPAARSLALRLLQLVGSEAQVPLLERLLADASLREAARSALEAIPGDASLRALRAALERLPAEALPGVLGSLGARRDGASVPAIARHLKASSAALAVAAADALGRIGTHEAAEVLLAARDGATGAPQAVRVALIDALLAAAGRAASADPASAASAAEVYRWLDAPGEPARVRVAALRGLASAAPGAALERVLAALSSEDALLRGSALEVAARLPGEAATKTLAGALPGLAPPLQAALLEALARRGDPSARGAVLSLLEGGGAAEAARAAAAAALGRLGGAEDVARLAALAAGRGKDAGPVAEAAFRSLCALQAAGADEAVRAAALEGDAATRAACLRATAERQAPGAPDLLLEAARDPEALVRVAALDGLGSCSGPEVYPRLAKLLEAARSAEEDAAARKAVIASAARLPDAASRVKPLAEALEKAAPARKGALLGALGALGGPEALAVVRAQLAGPDAAACAAAFEALVRWPDPSALGDLRRLACEGGDAGRRARALEGYLRLARPLVRKERERLKEELKQVLAAASAGVPEPVLAEAKRLLAEAEKTPADAVAALRRDPARSAARKQEIAARAPRRFRLAAYLDCGPDVEDGAAGGPCLRRAAGEPHLWPDSVLAAPLSQATILFDSAEVVFEASGLKPESGYRLGFTWWDYDSNGRTETVVLATGKGERPKAVIEKASLPGYTRGGEPPQERVVPVPRDLYQDGTLRIAFRNEGSTNAVVAEVWLWERPAAAGERPQPLRILILTGDDYPGHQWRLTSPVLRAVLEEEPRFEVALVDKPDYLASPELGRHDVVVLQWMNWEKPDPGPAARENLKRLVEGGKGLVLIHFACGAFKDWPEFRSLAGRVYDPKLPPHDPYGRFRVEIARPEHPVTRGLQDFETTDELYTCLAGEAPVEVIATARSKVTGKDEPMAIAHGYGKGRVFQSPLGHDVRALESPAVQELLRRGVAWAGGIDP
ncbi:MAG: ThuA domain-containing protein [Planctomycetes bacterium]|nr:ThuA domain-containing protein [Planctomycetota bacterium]